MFKIQSFKRNKNIVNVVKRLFSDNLCVRENVLKKIRNGDPVVALESTIITHGMPFPENYRTAKNVEDIIKSHGVTPATVGIIDGKLIVGLTDEELQFLSQPSAVHKTSRRDLGFVLSQGLHGGTTVSATMLAAKMAGISIFVTGGIGGVHRGAEKSFDISADLTELGKTPIAVVCAGVKSILDIGLTLEYLETQGVPVITYGKTTHFPSFFTPVSNYKSPLHLEKASDIANCIYAQEKLDLESGILVAVPIPDEDKNTGEEIERAIEQALVKASDLNVKGKEITPFVLSEVSKLSDGASLLANIHLIENNAKVSAEIADHLSKLKKEEQGLNLHPVELNTKEQDEKEKIQRVQIKANCSSNSKRPVVIGGAVLDIKATATNFHSIAETTNEGKVHISSGGVARNIAECLVRLDCNPLLISAVGEDKQGEILINEMEKINMDISGISVGKEDTASYSIIANKGGELLMAIGDMDIHDTITNQMIDNQIETIGNASIVIIDENIPINTIAHVQQVCAMNNVPVWLEPTCVSKCHRAFMQKNTLPFQYASPNALELETICSFISNTAHNFIPECVVEEDLDRVLSICKDYASQLSINFENLIISLGRHGVLDINCLEDTGNHNSLIHYQPACSELLPVAVKSVSGAGDSFVGGMVFGLINNYRREHAVKCGLKAAYMSLLSFNSVSTHLCSQDFTEIKIEEWAPFSGKVVQ